MEKFKVFVAIYLLLEHEGKILFSRRFNTGYQDGNYSLVAGHLNGGETAKQCIIREAAEEIGITLHPEDLEEVQVTHRMADREYFHVYIRAGKWTGDMVNMEPNKCDDLKWFPADQLPNNMVPEVGPALERIRRGEFYGEMEG